MVFTIHSQYIDSVGKLRIIYGFFNKNKNELINILTFPLPPLDKVPYDPHNKIKSFPINKINPFIEDLKRELNCTDVIPTSTGYWFKNSTFPPSVFVPIDETDIKTNDVLPFPLMVDGSDKPSKLDVYKDRVHKANIFKQYVLFLYACEPRSYSLENSFVIKGKDHHYDFEKWDPPNWLSLENTKMFVLNPSFKLSQLSELPPLSQLTSEMFRNLNSERLKMCFEQGRGECKTEHLPKPTAPGKWKEYRSPGGGHCLFSHGSARGC